MKIKKLDVRGFSHDLIIVAILLVFAIVGVATLVSNRVNANSNPNNCKIQAASTAPAAGQPALINSYFNSSAFGKKFNDHYFTITRNDTGLAGFGYCWASGEGYAYSTQVTVQGVQTVPMYEYWSPSILKHFFTTAPSNIEPKGCCGYQYSNVAFYVFPNGSVSGTTPLYRYYNKTTQAHTYTIDGSAHTKAVLATNYGYNFEGIAGYVWPNKPGLNGSASTTETGNNGVPTSSVAVKAPATSTSTTSGGGFSTGSSVKNPDTVNNHPATGTGSSGSSSSKTTTPKTSGSSSSSSSSSNTFTKTPGSPTDKEAAGGSTGSGSSSSSSSSKNTQVCNSFGCSHTSTPTPDINTTSASPPPDLVHITTPPTWTATPTPKVDEPIVCHLPVISGWNTGCRTVWSTKALDQKAGVVTNVTQPKGVPPATPPGPASYFTVKGTKVYGPNGKTFIPYGISVVTDLVQKVWYNSIYEQATDAQIQAAAKYWHSNTIRIQVSEVNFIGNANSTNAFNRLGQEVDEIESEGKVPVISDNLEQSYCQQLGPTQRTVQFWNQVAQFLATRDSTKYKNVIFDVFNEPSTQGSVWAQGGSYTGSCAQEDGGSVTSTATYLGMQDLINSIRSGPTVLANNLIWAESTRAGSAFSDLGSHMLTGSNIEYSFHHVNMNDKSQWSIQSGVSQNLDVPIVDGEWAQYASSRPECYTDGAKNTPAYLSFLRNNGIGMVFWSLEPGVGTQSDTGYASVSDKVTALFPTDAADYSKPTKFNSPWKCYGGGSTDLHSDLIGFGAGQQVMDYFKKYSN
ncbi:MAG TPA: cellulase family glycosylhydrolase [Candidatus Saccharimonadia bacterium]|nr:cellulase family glycosylhydrolase [Candidatus Saccharimonadia bacterium]